MLRLAAIGRKNWLFFGSANGGKIGCILYTILGSARRHGLNEFEYLVDLLERLSDLSSEAERFDLLPDPMETPNTIKSPTTGTTNDYLSTHAVRGAMTYCPFHLSINAMNASLSVGSGRVPDWTDNFNASGVPSAMVSPR